MECHWQLSHNAGEIFENDFTSGHGFGVLIVYFIVVGLFYVFCEM